MKHLFLTITLLFSIIASGQEKIIKLLPNVGQGYLVLDKTVNTNIDFWSVSLIHRTFGADGSFKDDVIKQTELFGINYINIPKEITASTETYLIQVEAYSAAKEIIISEGPVQVSIGTGSYTEVCKWTCNGITYAFDIKQAVHPNGGSSIFSLNTSFDYFNTSIQMAIPYYQYMTDNAFLNTYCPSGDWTQFTSSCSSNGITIVGPLNGNSGNYRDATNNVLSGNVYGVMKTLGPWHGNFIQTPDQAFGNTVCANDLNWAINLMNTAALGTLFSSQGMPNLQCIPSFDSDPSGSGFNPECLLLLQSFILGEDGDIFDLLSQIEACNSGGSSTHWWEEIDNVIVNDLDKFSTPTVINSSDLFNANGEFVSPNITLNPSLYSIGISLKNGQYIPLVKELKKPLVNAYELANLLDVVIFPVPIPGEQFEINFQAHAKLKFDYVLTDFNGNELFRKNFVIQEGQDRNHTIKPKKTMPSGFLVNLFIFEDGSVKSVQTIKE